MLDDHRNPDGTYDGVGAIGEITGLGRDEMLVIWKRAKENSSRLDACPWHDFAPIPGTANAAGLRPRYRCIHCGGEVDANAHYWHEKGRRARP